MNRAKEIDRNRPSLTDKQVDELQVGDKVRDIPGDPCELLAINPGKYGERLFVLAHWHRRHQCWKYQVQTAYAMTILFTPHRMPTA